MSGYNIAMTETRSRISASVMLQLGFCLSIFLTTSMSRAAEFTGYGVLTSDYVFRGVSYSDSHAAAQLGGDVWFESGIYFGAWVSTVDIGSGSGRQRDLQANYYVGYGFDMTNSLSFAVNAVSYNFPGAEGGFEYEYFEYSLTANYDDRVWFEYSYSPDFYKTGESIQNFDLYSEWQAVGELILGAGVGYHDLTNFVDADYSYWQLGATYPVGLVDLDLRYHDTSDYVPLFSSPERAEARIVLSLRFQF